MVIWHNGKKTAGAVIAALSLALILAGAVSGGALAAGSVNSGQIQSGSAAGAVNAQIHSCVEQLKGLTADLNGLVAQLRALNDQLTDLYSRKPLAPGPKASDSDKAKYQKALADWQYQVNTIQNSISTVKQQVQAKMNEIAQKKEELAGLENTRLPLAQAQDRATLENEIRSTEKQVDTATKEAKESLAKTAQ